MQPCDDTGGNVNKVPKWVKEKAMNDQRVKNAVAYHTPAIKSGWVRAIAKPLLVAGAGILVVLAAVNIFTGPIDDVAAWAALSAALAW